MVLYFIGLILLALSAFYEGRELRRSIRENVRLQLENRRLRQLWDSTVGASPPESTVGSMLQIISASKPAGVTTEAVLVDLLATVRKYGEP